MEDGCHVSDGAPSGYLELVDNPQKRICRTVCLHLQLLLNPWQSSKCDQLNSFLQDFFGRCFAEPAQLVPLLFSRGRSTRYFDKLQDFFVTIPRCDKDVYVNSFFPCTARLWNSLPIECFPLTYNLNGFKSRINRHLLTLGSL